VSLGQSGQVRKISPPTGIRSLVRPVRSESLNRLSYPRPTMCTPVVNRNQFDHVYTLKAMMPSLITLHVSIASSSIRCLALVLGTFTVELYVRVYVWQARK